MFELAGITIHWYGLLVGLGLLVGWELIKRQAIRQHISPEALDSAALWAIPFGIFGARVYHVVTDFSLYQSNLVSALYIWQGGLSIIGAVMGGVIGVWVGHRLRRFSLSVLAVIDLAVFGLPVGQAIGRVGNYVNQELYGPPTNAPWGIYIEPAHRVVGYEQFARFQPLFAYEMIALLMFAVIIWWLASKKTSSPTVSPWKIGSGTYFDSYLLFYSGLRFSLDFLRIDKTVLPWASIGVNQLVMLAVAVLASIYLFRKLHANHQSP